MIIIAEVSAGIVSLKYKYKNVRIMALYCCKRLKSCTVPKFAIDKTGIFI